MMERARRRLLLLAAAAAAWFTTEAQVGFSCLAGSSRAVSLATGDAPRHVALQAYVEEEDGMQAEDVREKGKDRKKAPEKARERKKKDDKIELEGIVIQHARTCFKVQLENDAVIQCTLGGRLVKNKIKVLEGDQVTVEMSPFDLERGRIVFRTIDKGPPPAGARPKKKGRR
mmetsp:Transcript_25829/g.59627  ORF Transcript_25829/g.59627 Transcript_25829/m.59627 type:complete len:172 (-) Transcript_25829:97-612(-)